MKTIHVIQIAAKELTPSTVSPVAVSKANVTVYIEDENDNPPVFLQGRYEAILAENVTAGTVVTQVSVVAVPLIINPSHLKALNIRTMKISR